MPDNDNKDSHKIKKGDGLTSLDRRSSNMLVRQSFQGPIPPPAVLAQYEELSPGLANRIVAMAEQEGNHRRNLESTHLKAQIEHLERSDFEAKLGQCFAFLIAITAILGGVYAIVNNYAIAGSFITTLGIGGIVATFIRGRFTETHSSKKQENTETVSKN